MSVTPEAFTDEWRKQVLDFYGELFGWKEIDSLRLPDRMTIAVGGQYVNVRARDDAPTYNGYEHFGVSFSSADELRAVWKAVRDHEAGIDLAPINESGDGFLSFKFRHLLPLAVEPQYFPRRET
jgi:hypothetical protein